MPIEIKELIIKVTVSDSEKPQTEGTMLSNVAMMQLQAGLIETCVKKVLEKLKEREEP